MNLEIGGHKIRVACNRRVARRLRSALGEYTISELAPLGFVLHPARLRHRQHSLVDRCGFVLGTASDTTAAVAAISNHLAALLPPPKNLVRFRIRALVRSGQATLCMWPLVFVPPLNIDHLRVTGHEVIDSLAVDIDPATGAMVKIPWRDAAPQIGVSGVETMDVSALMVACPPNLPPPPPAQLIADLASEAMAGSHQDVLSAAEAIVGAATVVRVDLRSPESFYEALKP